MNRSFFSKTKFMIGVGLKNLARTPVRKLSQATPPPSPIGVCGGGGGGEGAFNCHVGVCIPCLFLTVPWGDM